MSFICYRILYRIPYRILYRIDSLFYRFQACIDVMGEYKQLLEGLDDEEVMTVYYNCCMDQLLDTGLFDYLFKG